jgi:hypothetical protein
VTKKVVGVFVRFRASFNIIIIISYMEFEEAKSFKPGLFFPMKTITL